MLPLVVKAKEASAVVLMIADSAENERHREE